MVVNTFNPYRPSPAWPSYPTRVQDPEGPGNEESKGYEALTCCTVGETPNYYLEENEDAGCVGPKLVDYGHGINAIVLRLDRARSEGGMQHNAFIGRARFTLSPYTKSQVSKIFFSLNWAICNIYVSCKGLLGILSLPWTSLPELRSRAPPWQALSLSHPRAAPPNNIYYFADFVGRTRMRILSLSLSLSLSVYLSLYSLSLLPLYLPSLPFPLSISCRSIYLSVCLSIYLLPLPVLKIVLEHFERCDPEPCPIEDEQERVIKDIEQHTCIQHLLRHAWSSAPPSHLGQQVDKGLLGLYNPQISQSIAVKDG